MQVFLVNSLLLDEFLTAASKRSLWPVNNLNSVLTMPSEILSDVPESLDDLPARHYLLPCVLAVVWIKVF